MDAQKNIKDLAEVIGISEYECENFLKSFFAQKAKLNVTDISTVFIEKSTEYSNIYYMNSECFIENTDSPTGREILIYFLHLDEFKNFI